MQVHKESMIPNQKHQPIITHSQYFIFHSQTSISDVRSITLYYRISIKAATKKANLQPFSNLFPISQTQTLLEILSLILFFSFKGRHPCNNIQTFHVLHSSVLLLLLLLDHHLII